MADNKSYAVVNTGSEWRAVAIVEEYFLDGIGHVFEGVSADDAEDTITVIPEYVLARFDTADAANKALASAQALEQKLRPMWTAAVEHASRLKMQMYRSVVAELEKHNG